MSSSPYIVPLPRSTSTTIRSSVVIPNFPQVLAELLQNAVDAGADRIDSWIDLTSGGESLRIEDDGCGIDQAALRSEEHTSELQSR
ncbi:MAG: DNA mismatch repair protein, partial [Tremellales sp. Tagirdzhanova-0007]